jgi:hypothetical protein
VTPALIPLAIAAPRKLRVVYHDAALVKAVTGGTIRTGPPLELACGLHVEAQILECPRLVALRPGDSFKVFSSEPSTRPDLHGPLNGSLRDAVNEEVVDVESL